MLSPINPPKSNWPGVSQAVMGEGKVVVTTGHVGVDETGEPITSSVEDQVVAVFESMAATLGAAGLGFDHVARVTSYVKSYDSEFMDTFRAVRNRYLNQDCPPASVMVQAGLIDDRFLVECEFIAIAP